MNHFKRDAQKSALEFDFIHKRTLDFHRTLQYLAGNEIYLPREDVAHTEHTKGIDGKVSLVVWDV